MYSTVPRNGTCSAAVHKAAAVQFLLKTKSWIGGAFHERVGGATEGQAEDLDAEIATGVNAVKFMTMMTLDSGLEMETRTKFVSQDGLRKRIEPGIYCVPSEYTEQEDRPALR